MFKKKIRIQVKFLTIFSLRMLFLVIISPNIYSSESSGNNPANEQTPGQIVDQSGNSTNSDGWIDIANGWIYDNWR